MSKSRNYSREFIFLATILCYIIDGLASSVYAHHNVQLTRANIRNYSIQIREKPDDPSLYFERSKNLALEARFDEAIDDLNKTIELGNDSAEAYSLLANCLLWRGNYFEAGKNYGISFEKGRREEKQIVVWAMSYAQGGNYVKMVEIADKGLALHPGSVQLVMVKAEGLARLGKPREAIAYFNKLLEKKRGVPKLIRKRADLLVKLGMYEEAITDYTFLASRMIEPYRYVLKRGLCYRKLGNNELAEQDYLAVIRMINEQIEDNSGDFQAWYYSERAKAHKAFDRNKEALEDINIAVKQNPRNLRYLKIRADLYGKAGKADLEKIDRDLIWKIEGVTLAPGTPVFPTPTG